MTELIQYVNSDGSLTGETEEKLAAHHGHTRKHLAFSCYVFDADGKLVVTQRALAKKVWPGVWTNSCCGHPMPGEAMEAAIMRRLAFELGITEVDSLTCVLPTFSYDTPPLNGIIENEFCPVYIAKLTGPMRPNPEEVEEARHMSWSDFKAWVARDPQIFSDWCKKQIPLLDEAVGQLTQSQTS